MKKIYYFAAWISLSLIWFANFIISANENIWLSDVIYTSWENFDSINEQPSLLNEISFDTVKLQLEIWWIDTNFLDTEWNTLWTIKRLEELTKTDIISVLEFTNDKNAALEKYLSETNFELDKADLLINIIKQELIILNQDLSSCTTDKKVADKSYFQSIGNYDQEVMKDSLENSLQANECMSEKRIKFNSKTVLLNKLVFYQWLLKQKHDFIFIKQDLILQNFDIIKDNLAGELQNVNEVLQKYNF